jgi:hypothetical protein
MTKTIEVVVSPIGDISIDAVGFKGTDCDQATKFLEEALGTVAAKAKKPEYHQHRSATNQQKVGG